MHCYHDDTSKIIRVRNRETYESVGIVKKNDHHVNPLFCTLMKNTGKNQLKC